ncbi:CHST1-like protein [Mya arenaria]|uniref:CHST1-like protein n=1 Tax=Mya arenaria TaxID=6604 RepID=A0ABY7DU33_MYAAR|nr:CHST1-like protein [Mya arenaria]
MESTCEDKYMAKHKMRLRKLATIGLTFLVVTAMVFYFTHGEITASRMGGSPKTTPGKPKLLLIVAYLRSGSTFTSSLRFPKGITDNPQSLFRECLDPWFHCAFRKVDTASILDKFHLYYSKSMKPFLLCVKQIKFLNPLTRYSINHCIGQTERKCNSAHLRVIKTIRLSMEMAHSLMKENENMKIVHLVRDPRAMFLSQSNYKLIKGNNKTSQFERLCSRIRDDVYFTRQLLETGNKNVKLVRYEDIAFNPIKMTKELYKFIGEPLTKEVLKYVTQSTSLNLKDGCPFCTRRGNSSLTASKWRSRIQPSFLKLVDEHCKDLLQPLGYHITEDINYLRNTSLPIFQEHIPLLEQI